jgi:group I intron endonuclease
MAIVYCTHNKINGKKYIGSHNNKFPNYLGSGFNLKAAIKKYGKSNFHKIILWEGEDKYRYEMEEYWITYFDSPNNPLFYNISDKGVGCPSGKYLFPKTQEVKDKISNSMKGKNTWSVGAHTSKKVNQLDLNGNYLKTYISVSEAMRQTGIKTIFFCVLGRTKKAGGYKWEYV